MSDTASTRQLGRVLVLGLGKTGVGVAEYCLGLVACGRVTSVDVWGGLKSTASDDTRFLEAAGATMHLGSEQVTGEYDLMVAGPGISENSDFFHAGAACSTEAIGEPELAWRESPNRWIGITGTNGKTTTTTLVRDLMCAAGLSAQEVGNIGTLAISCVDGRPADQWFCAELSSYQLATTKQLHPSVAVLLNITPDHLAWHGSHEAYVAAKERIFANMDDSDLAIVGVDDATCANIATRLEARGLRVCRLSCTKVLDDPCAAFVRDGELVVRLDGTEHKLVRASELSIKGSHNVENALAAAAAALEAGAELAGVTKGLLSFAPLEHRIEPCGSIDGIEIVNDSKATNTDAVLKALTAFEPGHVVVLLGGHDKGTELEEFSAQVAASAKAVVAFGEAGDRFAKSLEAASPTLTVTRAAHLEQALDAGLSLASAGDTVLLSPACSSFDEFSGFEERGRVFKQLAADRIARRA